jgi:hypothetical protein
MNAFYPAGTVLLLLTLAGCSARDKPNYTPVYHVGTPTNRSSTNSFEANHEPFYTQPGVNAGSAVTLKPIASQRGFEPSDPLAQKVYIALSADGTVPTQYLTCGAKDGVVLLTGTVQTAAQAAQAKKIALGVPGVKAMRSHIRVTQEGNAP